MGKSSLGRKPFKVPPRDGRSAPARLLRRTKAALVEHVGGRPSATQMQLIDRAAMLTMHIARMDARAVEDGGFSDWASRQYLAWSNTLTRTLAALGLRPSVEPAPDLAQYLASRAATQPPASGGAAP